MTNVLNSKLVGLVEFVAKPINPAAIDGHHFAHPMLIFANTVVARGTPWDDEPPARNRSIAAPLSVS
jgi:hypothetical protein